MSELRYNILTRDWVIIATERAKRPEAFRRPAAEVAVLPGYDKSCPFCPGNEGDLSDETFRLGDKNAWRVRSVYNKFPALSPATEEVRRPNLLYNSMSGFGVHEVIVEHPRHDMNIALMSEGEVEDIIRTYKERYLSIQKDRRIEAIIIFKNQGPSAGASQRHPHSQLVATPIVPPHIRNRMDQATRYFDGAGRCIFCRILEDELKFKERIVLETGHFVAYMPYASYVPFTMIVQPKRHAPSFDEISEDEIKDLAKCLKVTLGKLYKGLGDPDYNYTIRSIPIREKGVEYFHWTLNIVPRLTQPAGFEMGSGIFINTALPEEAARFLRNIK
jgi:UDPglucose--hexose-1-phosphate uridylyltransferase